MGMVSQGTSVLSLIHISVDIVLCDEHFALTQEAGLSIKVPFLVWQVIEDDADAVGAIR